MSGFVYFRGCCQKNMPRNLLYTSLLWTLMSIAGVAPAQPGLFYTNHYNPSLYGYDNDNFALLQDDRHMLHLANRQGVLHYDGYSWWLTPTPYAIYSLSWYDGSMFAGGRHGLGMLTRNRPGEWSFVPLDSLHGHITATVMWHDSLYYLAGNLLLAMDARQPQSMDTLYRSASELLDLTAGPRGVYVSDEDRGLLIFRADKQVLPASPPNAILARFSASGRALYFTDSAGFYISHGARLQKVVYDNIQYLHDHDITDIIWVNDSLVAIGTLPGGVFFMNPNTGQTVQVVDYDAGLPDNQINALYANAAGEVWALHPEGLSLIAPELPLSCYHHYRGLRGNLTKLLPHNGKLLVGTSLGLFRLAKKPQVRKTTLFYRVKVPLDKTEEEHRETDKKRKKFLGLFNRKNKSTRSNQQESKLYKYEYRRKVIEEVVSVNYEYEQIKEIEAKTEDLLHYNGQVIAGTVHGIYYIVQDSAVLIDQVPVRDLFGMPGQNLLFASTYDDEVRTYTYRSGHWDALNLMEGLHDHIEQIALDPQGAVWLCGMDSLYRLEIEHNSLTDVEVFGIANPHYEHIYSVNYEGEILFINSTGYFTYRNRQIVRYKEIEEQIGLPRKYVVGQDGELWINTGQAWYGANKDIKNSLNFLSLFKDPQAVASSDNRTFWVITSANELYKVDAEKVARFKGSSEVFLKEVRDNNGRVAFDTDLEVKQENSSLTFEFVAPEYTGIGQKEFRYRLRSAGGSRSPWSAWSPANNTISYQFLAPGSYILEVQMRQALGEVLEAKPFHFKVIPPYWKRPWFYVGEVVFFGTLMLLSIYLNRGRKKYTVINRLLGFLTLILIVEFFQTIAEYEFGVNDSPVINFFIQAFIALLILPVEGVLRKWLTAEGKEKK